MGKKNIDSQEQNACDEKLVFLDNLPPIEKDSWKWVVLLVSTVQSMVLIGVYASSGIYMESLREVKH